MTTSSCGSKLFIAVPNKRVSFGSVFALFLLSVLCVAQQLDQLPDAPVPHLLAQTAPPQEPARQASPADVGDITVPAGTRLHLVLTQPVDSHSTPRGDQIFAQTTAPVIVDDKVVIPGGSYVQGKVDKLTRNGTRAETLMQSVSLVLPNGYIAQAGGPVNIESEEWTALNNPQGRAKAGIILAPLLGTGLGLAIGAATDKPRTVTVGGGSVSVPPGFPPVPPQPPLTVTQPSHKGLVIGGMVGGGLGAIASFTLIARNRQFYIQDGSPASFSLPKLLTLPQAQIADANRAAVNSPPPRVPVRPAIQAQAGPSNPVPNTGPGSCSLGQEWCQGQCVDTTAFLNDSQNCGRCGNSCSFSESCTGGSCSCAPGYSSCMGQCVNDASFMSDSQNCGHCGNSCAMGESCLGGSCAKIGP